MSETQRYCEQCGSPMRASAHFCGVCGHPVEAEPAPQPAPQPVAQPVVQTAAQPVEQQPQPRTQAQAWQAAEQVPQKKKSSFLTRLLIILVGLALLFLGLRGPILGVIGTSDSAVVTSINETEEDYTFNVSYRFVTADGKSGTGSLEQEAYNITTLPDVGDLIAVRYLPSAPWLNVPAKQTSPSLANLGISALGLVLILFSGKFTFGKSKNRR